MPPPKTARIERKYVGLTERKRGPNRRTINQHKRSSTIPNRIEQYTIYDRRISRLLGLVGQCKRIDGALADGEIRHRLGQRHPVLLATVTGIPTKKKKSAEQTHTE